MGKKATLYLLDNIIIVITLLLALAAVLGWLSAHVNPNNYELLPFVGLVQLIILAANVVMLLFWAVRLKLWALAPVAVLVLNIGFIFATFQFPTSSCDRNNERQINIATYNVHNFSFGEFKEVISNVGYFLRSEDVDIVCFQEFHETPKYSADSIAVQLGLPYFARAAATSGIDLAIFSRYPILSSVRKFFPDSESSMLISDLNVDGDTIRLINTHLQTTDVNHNRSKVSRSRLFGNTSQEREVLKVMVDSLTMNFKRRAVQAEIIARRVGQSPYPVIVCGDFNDTPASYTYNTILAAGMTDGFRSVGSGYGYTFRSMYKLLRIDYIMHDDNFKGLQYYSPENESSDHNPVIMKLFLERN